MFTRFIYVKGGATAGAHTPFTVTLMHALTLRRAPSFFRLNPCFPAAESQVLDFIK